VSSETGVVEHLFVSSKDQGRMVKESIDIDEGGVIGDKFHAKDFNRSILLSSERSYQLARDEGIEAPVGSLGENIISSIDLYGLGPGDRVKMGAVLLEISQNCTICNSLAKVDKRLPKILKSDRGIFAKCVTPGQIMLGDSISIEKVAHQ
jgi:MOSC domain-containing protein YiiM